MYKKDDIAQYLTVAIQKDKRYTYYTIIKLLVKIIWILNQNGIHFEGRK